ncbi:MAG TPA: glycosyltransferase family 4 protein [Burkholderiales bacterium]|nr:glycosyltransferase family 4 protein [Burkholderiales bacterium]
MKILTFSTLYPHAARPSHGIFVETRLRHLLASGKVESQVVAPVPWFPSDDARFGEYAIHARAPREEQRHGIQVLHPRYPLLPKIGMTISPFLLARAVRPLIERMLRSYPFDLIDAHYFYPDGVAAVMIGQRLGKPVVITARGTDVNLIPRYRLPRAMIRWAARRAAGMITVARALKDDLVGIGVPGERIEVLRNGVDLQLFRPIEREAARARLGFPRTTLLSVGLLITRKAHDLVIRALAALPGMDLVVVGDGPEREALAALARESRVGDRVRFVGSVPQEELRNYYGAADALVLASSREGWANVLLESMACGTPVVASRAGGSPEVVSAPEAGVLMAERTPEAVVEGVRRLFARRPDRAATRRYAEQFSWEETTRGQLRLFERVI